MARILPPSVFRREFSSASFEPTQTQRVGEEWAKPEGIKTAVNLTDVVGGTIADAVDQYSRKAEQTLNPPQSGQVGGGPVDYRQAAARLASAKSQAEAGKAFEDMGQAYNRPGSGRLSARWSGGPMNTMTEQYQRLLPKRFEDQNKGRGGSGQNSFSFNIKSAQEMNKRWENPNTEMGALNAALSWYGGGKDDQGNRVPVGPQWIPMDPVKIKGVETSRWRLRGSTEDEALYMGLESGDARRVAYENQMAALAQAVVDGHKKLENDPDARGHFQTRMNKLRRYIGIATSGAAIRDPNAAREFKLLSADRDVQAMVSSLMGPYGGGGSAGGLTQQLLQSVPPGDVGIGPLFPNVKDRLPQVLAEQKKGWKYPTKTPMDNHYQAASQATGVPFRLLRAMSFRESNHKPNAVSTVEAHLPRAGQKDRGLFQMSPGAARAMGLTVERGNDERLDPAKNALAGAKYIKSLIDKYNGDTRLALLAYNWGPGNTDRQIRAIRAGTAKKNFPLVSRNYARWIMTMANHDPGLPPAKPAPTPPPPTGGEGGMSLPPEQNMTEAPTASAPRAREQQARSNPEALAANSRAADLFRRATGLGATEEPAMSTEPAMSMSPADAGLPPAGQPPVDAGITLPQTASAPEPVDRNNYGAYTNLSEGAQSSRAQANQDANETFMTPVPTPTPVVRRAPPRAPAPESPRQEAAKTQTKKKESRVERAAISLANRKYSQRSFRAKLRKAKVTRKQWTTAVKKHAGKSDTVALAMKELGIK